MQGFRAAFEQSAADSVAGCTDECRILFGFDSRRKYNGNGTKAISRLGVEVPKLMHNIKYNKRGEPVTRIIYTLQFAEIDEEMFRSHMKMWRTVMTSVST